ncbi:NAD(P)/FAD-dependent oxidoreductase [Belliella sp. DSM 111904]|uniref:NAD(P)/FAD-dependent oxidoreductase n=1 Tax=Belliella filtrata TaxID=2923435 RepID=A0ABS9UVR0_9BACT|nr:NAD(P)/FAD-dependent oxidoreductase [Belliella filtrata]MCH7407888.1 NAD(P)/FAD-dependent oxidoreductase [Belliella filtrata]
MEETNFEVIIIGGSYSGLSAALALGRSLRKVLIIDSGNPCNKQTPHSRNFLTQDGEEPAVIALKAKRQVEKYPSINYLNDRVLEVAKQDMQFEVTTENEETFVAKKILFATGVRDIMPDIEGFAACWGISAIHCPYCHGYEVRGKKTAILANGNFAYHYAQLVSNLTDDLVIITQGIPEFTPEQMQKFATKNISIIPAKVQKIQHHDGHIESLMLEDGSEMKVDAIYHRPIFEQHTDILVKLGCEINEQGLITVDQMQRTTIDGVFASGDCTSPMRSVANAVASGNMAGAAINYALVDASF